MARTGSPKHSHSGYSLVELLVVLAIVAILVIAGVSALGNRGGNGVRVVMDELEGAILDAHKYASSTGKDVAIVTWGPYSANGTIPTMYMARGLTSIAANFATAIQTVVLTPPATPTAVQQTVATVFAPTRTREYMNAGVVDANTNANWWAIAMAANGQGRSNVDITTVAPFSTDANFQAANTAANNLFQSNLNSVTISGSNKRFNSSFIIQVVSTSSSGYAVPGGAMGLIVVLNNGATVYKFYNSGVNNGDGQWRRI
ncbi:MAG: prepilin-type N-terminal cleavage/methylation domain-containing protein [Geothrix sp.]|nr:prepilin-type N-terminal cleavage/methylation domain-containing protein [Geothrix sp.]